jgi:hypothetical protein
VPSAVWLPRAEPRRGTRTKLKWMDCMYMRGFKCLENQEDTRKDLVVAHSGQLTYFFQDGLCGKVMDLPCFVSKKWGLRP